MFKEYKMNQNYYEKLEVSQNASPEIIKKAYNVFVKKYHPDLWPDDKKAWAEEQMKQYNEAYETLINKEKRKNYDESLKIAATATTSEAINPTLNNNHESQNNINKNVFYQQEQEKFVNEINQTKAKIQEELKQKAEKEYNEAYENYLKSLGYEVKHKKTLKEYLTLFIAILIFIVICFIGWQIPFVRNYIINFYESNIIIKYIVDTILRFLKIT